MNWKIFLLFLIGWYSVQAQDHLRISLQLEDVSLEEALQEIEQKSGYTIYYANSWLDQNVIRASFEDSELSEILTELLEDTQLNFFITSEKRVILTLSNRIYDTLPEGYFNPEGTNIYDETEDAQVAPIVLNKQETSNTAAVETIRIGKEDRNSRTQKFTISGRITNRETGSPISNLAVVVRDKGIGTVTDETGYYRLELPAGLHRLETSSLGIEVGRKNVILYSDGTLNFELEESFEELDEVIVNAEARRNIEEAGTGSTTIGSEESKNIPLVLGERNVLKVATTLPGVTTAGEGSSGFNVRGGKTDQNLILLDKAVLYNPFHFFGIFQALNPFTVEDVTIYKGHIPAEFGGRLSSVFDITTKKVNTTALQGEGSVGPVTANLAVEIPVIKDKSGILLGGRIAYSDWVLQLLNESSLENSSADFYDAIVKYDHQINARNNLRVSGYFSNDAFSITSDSLYGYTNRVATLQWDHQLNDQHSMNVLIANSQYKFKIEYEGSEINNFTQGYTLNETELKSRFQYVVPEKHRISYGIAAKKYSVFPGEIKPLSSLDILTPFEVPKEQALESALFLSDTYTVNDRLQAEIGLRYSFFAALGEANPRIYQADLPKSDESVTDTLNFGKNDWVKTYGGPEFRISGRYLIDDNNSVKASFNNTLQYIHTLSNTTTVSPIDTWKLSDYHIKPQRASQWALGYYRNMKEGAFEISLETFYKKQQNLLDFKTGAKLLLNEFVETEVLQGQGRAYGAELLLRKNTGDLNGWIGYTYSRSFLRLSSEFREEEVNDGRYFPSNFDKPHDFSAVLNYKLTRRYSLSANFVYQTGRPVTFPVGNYAIDGIEFVLYSDRNQYRVPDYYRLDLGFNIEGSHKINKKFKSFWNISVYNVLGRNNPYSVFFVSDSGEIKALQSSIFAVPVPSITYNFKF